MSLDVHIHVCFACQENEPVAVLAAKHLDALKKSDDDGEREARWFLASLASRRGINQGPKGGLSLWGMVGNYTRGDVFCECLKPFWAELLRFGIGGICQHERVIVFVEAEQTDAASAYEIRLADPQGDDSAVEIRRHTNLPFSWSQY